MASKEVFWGREQQGYVSGSLILVQWLLTCYGAVRFNFSKTRSVPWDVIIGNVTKALVGR